MSNFSWVPFFEEMLNVICTKYNKDSLCKIFHQIFSDTKGRNDKFADGTEGPMREIDPLTFIAFFNRNNTSANRINYCSEAKTILGLESSVPKDFDGIPIFNALLTRFSDWSKNNSSDCMENLWSFSRQLNAGDIKPEFFYNILQIPNVGIAKLTQVIFICKPLKYISLDGTNIAFFKLKGIETADISKKIDSPDGFAFYQEFLKNIDHNFTNKKFYEISHEAYLARINEGYNITDEQFVMLKKRFDSRISGFIDFQNPGDFFEQNELDYKRKALKRYQEEVGNKQLRQWVEQGEGQKAREEISKRVGTNLVQFNSWRLSIGNDDKKSSAILKTFLDAAEGEYASSESLSPIFDATEKQELTVAWDTFSTLLWAMRPEIFAPVKIRYWRALAEELGHKLPRGRVTADKYEEVLEWMKMFWDELERRGYKPNDWVDVHSFIWCVCPDTYTDRKSEGNGNHPNSPHYWAIAPGENASQWEDFQKNSIIAINGSELGDLNNYQNKETIEQALQRELGITERKTNDALAYYEFANKMQIGDYVFAKQGIKKLLGYGKITSGYTYDHRREWGQHIRQVEWLKTGEWDLPENKSFTVKALTDITEKKDQVDVLLKLMEIAPRIPQKDSKAEVYAKEDAMEDLFIESDEFDGILQNLERKKNIILQGPPGVGKTFIAKRLAFAFIGSQDEQRVQTIQFHQSYSYEDFIQGYRPNDEGKFDLKNGVFYKFCEKAQQDKSNKYVFIIDEINRGNLSKIFGELMMLIESDKRGESYQMPLAYSKDGEKFYVPENLYLIGMMNTADRSLAMVDYALRRRFRFINLKPQFESEKFKQYLKEKGVRQELIDKIEQKLGKLNKTISDEKNNLGAGYQIGHSFFCPNGAGGYDEDWYKTVIDYEISPLLEEYWFDNTEQAKKLVAELL